METINFDQEFEDHWKHLTANSKTPESGFTSVLLEVAKLWAHSCFMLGTGLGATQACNEYDPVIEELEKECGRR